MKTIWTYAAVGGFLLSLSGAALADCAGHAQQSVKADTPMTVASAPASTTDKGDRK